MDTVLWIENPTPRVDTFVDAREVSQARTILANHLPRAIEILRGTQVEAILVQLPLGEDSTDDIVSQLRDAGRGIPIVVYEPDGSVSRGAAMTLLGAFQYISQPVRRSELFEVLSLAIRHHRSKVMQSQNERSLLVGGSPAMREVIEVIRLVGNRRSTILITGETGTGKEVAARAIHMASDRSSTRMVAVNCSALPDHLLEAELFGHTKGAFTGAVTARVGLFEQANHGTIFLDEIGEMPLQLQSKLLRVLQEREVQRVGSSEPIPIDVRVIAASNQNLAEAVAQKRFREDLFYRLNVVSLKIPPLRDRASDIPELVDHFLMKISRQECTSPKQIDPAALEKLMRYSWPGNVRQLEHALESAVALSGLRKVLEASDFDLPAEILATEMGPLASLDVPESGINFEKLINGIERRLLERALLKSGGNKARAANMLHMKRTTLISKFKSLEVCA